MTLVEKLMKKILSLKLVILQEYRMHRNNFAKGYTPNWSEEAFEIKKVNYTMPWAYPINDLNEEKIVGTFYKKEKQKTNQNEFRIENIIKKKGNKFYLQWKGYINLFHSWIDKKYIV